MALMKSGIQFQKKKNFGARMAWMVRSLWTDRTELV